MDGVRIILGHSRKASVFKEQVLSAMLSVCQWWNRHSSAFTRRLQCTWQDTVLYRPLVLVAGCFSLGVMLAHWKLVNGPTSVTLGLAMLGMPIFGSKVLAKAGRMPLLLSWCVLAGALWYTVQTMPIANDIALGIPDEGRWTWVRLRLLELHHVPAREEPLRSRPAGGYATALARAEAILTEGNWQSRTGIVRVSLRPGASNDLIGARLEVFGELVPVLPPGNPGQDSSGFADYARGITAHLHVRSFPEQARILEQARWYDVPAQMARLQAYFQQRLRELLPSDVSNLAQALLLGELSQVEPERLWRYQRTGVIHVLAISGQHLVILCGFVLWAGRICGATSRRLAWSLVALVWWYVLLTGARPATVRAALMVSVWCLAQRWARPAEAVNGLALAWLVIGIWDPRHWLDLGCQLSFLSALVLYTVAPALEVWLHHLRQSPLDRLEPVSFLRLAKDLVISWLYLSVIVGAVIWAVLAPMFAARVHLVSPSSILLTPLIVPLASVALVCGLALLLNLAVPGLNWALAYVVSAALRSMEAILTWGERLPFAYFYTSQPPAWWLLGFYLLLLAWLTLPGWLAMWRWIWTGTVVWGIFGWSLSFYPQHNDTLRLAFLDVGHGCCVVVECPDGRVWLYDAGSLQGPQVAERIIAPYLWSQGHRKLDAIVLSHGDLDHYNGLPKLLEQFRIGTVFTNPSFWEKGGAATLLVKDVLMRNKVRVDVLDNRAYVLSENANGVTDDCGTGKRMRGPVSHNVQSFEWQEPSGRTWAVQVLHPPPQGPEGSENARSLVLLLRYAGRQVLLTGDLEEPGLSQVLPRLPHGVDVLWAPHHGSPKANTPLLAETCRPGLVIVGNARRDSAGLQAYQAIGACVWETWREGAVLIRIDSRGVQAETYRTGRIWAR